MKEKLIHALKQAAFAFLSALTGAAIAPGALEAILSSFGL